MLGIGSKQISRNERKQMFTCNLIGRSSYSIKFDHVLLTTLVEAGLE